MNGETGTKEKETVQAETRTTTSQIWSLINLYFDLFSIAELVLGKIAFTALEEAIGIYGVENEISELRETLTTIKAVLLGAEDQQAKKRNLQVWLDQLEDISYDVEDVLDELECEALRKQVIGRYGGVKEKVLFFSLSNPLILRDKISHRVKEIKKRISRISTEKDRFDLNVESADDSVAHMHSREVTYSYVNKSDVIGRDTDKEKIIETLMQPTYDKNLTVIPIIGIGDGHLAKRKRSLVLNSLRLEIILLKNHKECLSLR
ncbi:hypothetical protein NL676_001801 [Syzygium grande]|nr:hypothetical protein NL676_001801 [Syzygium grande]